MNGKNLHKLILESGTHKRDWCKLTGISERTMGFQFKKETVPVKYINKLREKGLKIPQEEQSADSALMSYSSLTAINLLKEQVDRLTKENENINRILSSHAELISSLVSKVLKGEG